MTDASDSAVSVLLHRRVDGELAPISYCCRLFNIAERKHITYDKQCLAVTFSCEKCRIYLVHKEFEIHCENLPLCWLLKRVKDVGRLGRWILRVAPIKFRVKHTRGMDNVVANARSQNFEGDSCENSSTNCVALLQSLPLVYSSLEEHQLQDPFCVHFRDKAGQAGVDNFQMSRGILCYYPKG